MTTPARMAEADRVELVFYWALGQLGAGIAVDALDVWADMPTNQEQAARAAWYLAEMLELLADFRSVATTLAIAYYRLVRALRTGSTVAHGGEQDGDTVSLNQLRDDFEQVVDEIETETSDVTYPGWDDDESPFADEPELELGDDNDEIEVEDIADIDQMVEQLNEAADEEAVTALDALGTENLIRKLDAIDPESEARDDDRQQAHQDAGSRQAAAAARIMMNAARGLNYSLADTDLKVIGWVRYSKTGSPCGWCAMLISRGLVYKTRAQATGKSSNAPSVQRGEAKETDQYHDNCKCVAVPIFILAQYEGNPLFDQNREYQRLWNKFIKGKFGGKDALSKWRFYIRNGFPGDAPQLPTQVAA